jgi:two-component SAPR family response regulator
MMEKVQDGVDPDRLRQMGEKALNLYGGPLLHSETYQNWTVASRERLRSKYLRLISGMARLSDRTDRGKEAMEYYMKGLETEPLAEEFHQGLMRAYRRLGRHAEAVAAYQRCKRILHAELGVAPSARTEALRAEIQKAARK